MLILLVGCTPPEPEGSERPRPVEEIDPSVPGTETDAGSVPDEPEPGQWLLEAGEVREIAMWIGEAELESLAVAPDAWVPAEITVDDIVLANVGVRLKGNGSFQPIGGKPSFKLEVDRWTDGQELDGLDELVLNNMVTDASCVRERLAYAVYRQLGIPAPRATHVTLRVNDEPYGLYLLLEDADGRFLDRWFEDGDGPLYEMFDVELTPSGVWQLDHDGGPDDRRALLGLAEVLADPSARVSVEGAAWLDVEQFAAYFGASGVIGQFDAYPYSFPGDDVYLYVDPSDDRIRFLPHGGDETFTDPFRPVDYVFGLLATRCLQDVGCEEPWAERAWAAQDAVEAMDLPGLITIWGARMGTHVRADPKMPWTPAQVVEAQGAVAEFVVGRRERLEAMPGL